MATFKVGDLVRVSSDRDATIYKIISIMPDQRGCYIREEGSINDMPFREQRFDLSLLKAPAIGSTRTSYKATLCNSAGQLDFISADDLETLTRHLGKRLVAGEWTLAEGDTIIVAAYETRRRPR